MRKTLFLLCFVAFLGVTLPAEAQLREEVREAHAPVRLFGTQGPGLLFNTLFDPAHFQMYHTYEMSFGSFGGHGSSLGMYTNTMAWRFDDKLAARVDVSFAFTPFSEGFGPERQNSRIFLRNAEVAYRPFKNVQFHLQMRQSPYGSYASPYGYYGPYGGYGYSPLPADHLFWDRADRR